jgi:hypothetical protein
MEAAGLPLRTLIRDHRYDESYLAWEVVRLCSNPFFDHGTGFEGYLVGTCPTPEAALADLLAIMRGILDSITRRYRLEYGLRRRLMHTLFGDLTDREGIEIWSTWLGITLARLRCNLLYNPPALAFRNETYRTVTTLKPIRYQQAFHSIEQEYEVKGEPPQRRLAIGWIDLPERDQEAWAMALVLGRFGHPLLRQVVANNWMQTLYP